MVRHIVILVVICLCTTISSGQFLPSHENLLGDGLSVSGRLGHLAIRDQYISDEKYSGAFPAFSVFWLRSDTTSAYRLGFDYAGSRNIRNHNVAAQVTQSALTLDFLQSVGRFQLLGQDIVAYAGPSAELFLYYRQQQIATGGNALFNAYSFAFFFSLSANSTLVLPFSSDFSAESSARLAFLSTAVRLVDLHDKNASFFKLVSIFSGLCGYTEFLARYDVSEIFLLKAGYRFEIRQSSSWDYLLSASDNIVFIVTVRL